MHSTISDIKSTDENRVASLNLLRITVWTLTNVRQYRSQIYDTTKEFKTWTSVKNEVTLTGIWKIGSHGDICINFCLVANNFNYFSFEV